ncbi:MAG: TetR/AcrR family transcriptional regulator [Chloroflexi bacterium]|nr:TetR/AcrR family transcriptional regulator [Chloroflexota bacterium]
MPISGVTLESPTRLERKRARNRDALVAAARRLFTRDGFEATTIAAIAEEADLGFGTFYRYFEDKTAALRAVLEEAVREIDRVLRAEDDADVPAAEALARLTDRVVRAAARNRSVFALWWEVSMHSGKSRRLGPPNTPPLPVSLAQAIEGLIARGVESGEFAPGDTALRSGFIAGAHLHVLAPPAGRHEEQDVIDALCDFELRALGVAPAQGTKDRKGRATR